MLFLEQASLPWCIPTNLCPHFGHSIFLTNNSNYFPFQSFKSKQLVRSQAIRESTSPPRTISPSFQPPYQAPEYSDRTSPYQVTTDRTLSPSYQATTDRTLSPSYQVTTDRTLSPSYPVTTDRSLSPSYQSTSDLSPYHVATAGDRTPSPSGRPPYRATSNDRIAPNGRYQVTATDSSQDDYDKCDIRKTVEIQVS